MVYTIRSTVYRELLSLFAFARLLRALLLNAFKALRRITNFTNPAVNYHNSIEVRIRQYQYGDSPGSQLQIYDPI